MPKPQRLPQQHPLRTYNVCYIESIQNRFEEYPFTILLNKSDCSDSGRLKEMTQDYEQFLSVLHEDNSYLATLSKQIVLHLSDFYCKLKFSPISAKTGEGVLEVVE